MGGAALARFKGDVARAFIDGSPVCASGYYHGVLERGFAGVEDSQLAAKARDLCADRSWPPPRSCSSSATTGSATA